MWVLSNVELQKSVRISVAIENAAHIITVGLVLLAIAVSSGIAQLFIGAFGSFWIFVVIKGLSNENKELKYHKLFVSDAENSSNNEAESK